MSGGPMYRKGVRAEKKVAALLRAEGYKIMESRGSHGPADLVAIKAGQILVIQVKAGTAQLRDEWWNPLYEHATEAGALAIIAETPRGKVRMRRITGRHRFRSRLWPCEEFTTDEAVAR
jgi:Holliday junction resolvase